MQLTVPLFVHNVESHYSGMFRLSLLRPVVRPLLTATRFAIPSVRFSSGRKSKAILNDSREARSLFEIERHADAASFGAKHAWSHWVMDREGGVEETEQGDH